MLNHKLQTAKRDRDKALGEAASQADRAAAAELALRDTSIRLEGLIRELKIEMGVLRADLGECNTPGAVRDRLERLLKASTPPRDSDHLTPALGIRPTAPVGKRDS